MKVTNEEFFVCVFSPQTLLNILNFYNARNNLKNKFRCLSKNVKIWLTRKSICYFWPIYTNLNNSIREWIFGSVAHANSLLLSVEFFDKFFGKIVGIFGSLNNSTSTDSGKIKEDYITQMYRKLIEVLKIPFNSCNSSKSKIPHVHNTFPGIHSETIYFHFKKFSLIPSRFECNNLLGSTQKSSFSPAFHVNFKFWISLECFWNSLLIFD